MSLIHWWPLDGDAQDKLVNSSIRIGNYTLSANGKIGSCLKNSYPGFQTSVELVNEWSHWKRSVSMSCWVKLNYDECNTYFKSLSYSSTAPSPTGCLIGQTSYGGLGIHWYTSNLYNNGTIANATAISFRGYTRGSGSIATTAGVTVESDKWYHMTLVADYDKKVLRFYVNGTQIGGDTSYKSIPEMTDVRYFGWGRGEIWSGNGPAGFLPMWINDVRLYDHALSQAEVKELSKALVIHYTFNDVLAEPTINIDPCKDSLITHSYPGASLGAIKCTYGTFHGCDCVEMHLNATYSSTTWIYMNTNPISQGAKVGDTVTRSCWMYVPSGQTKPPHFTESIEGNSSGQKFVQYDHNKCDTWQRVSLTGTIADTGTNNYLHYFMAGSGTVNYKWYMRDFQMEINDHATPYTPDSRDCMLVNEAGYLNPSSTTKFKLSTVSNNGSYSGYFDGQTSCIDTPVIKPNMFTEDYTLSFWVYPLDSGRSVYFGDHTLSSVKTINFERNADGTFRYYHDGSPDKSFANTYTPEKTWTMLTVTYTPGTMKVYKNGVLAETFSHTATITKNTSGVMRIGRDKRTGSDSGATPLYGYISDFRFYATYLSSDDIKNLYKTKAYISDKGDICCGQFIEDKSQAQITSKGTFEAKNFYEEIDEGYEVLEYIENASPNNLQGPTPSIDTGIIPKLPFKAVAEITTVDTAASNEDGVLLGVSSSGSFIPFYIYQGKWHCDDLGVRIGDAPNNTYFKAEYEATSSQRITTINGVQNIYNGSRTLPNASLWVMNGRWTGSQLNRGANVKLHKLTIVNEGKLERYYIPVRQKSTGNIGLYDCVYRVFYEENSGSSIPFTAGSTLINGEASIYATQNVSGRNLKEI